MGKPTEVLKRSWSDVLKRTVREFNDDHVVDWAAALTYYGILAIFPALLALVSLLGLVGASATQPLIDNLGTVAPGPAKEIFTRAVDNLQKSQGTGGVLFVVGLAGALWSASGYVGAFMRASNYIYDVEEGRPIWKKAPVRPGVTLVLVVLSVLSALAVVVTGTLADQVGDLVGVGDAAVTAWDILKWPVLLLVVSTMFSILYWVQQDLQRPRRGHHLPRLVVALQRRRSARGRVQRRGRTGPPDGGRNPAGEGAIPGARHEENEELNLGNG